MLVSGMVYLGLAVAWPGSALGTAPEPGTPGEPLRVLYETERDATDGEDRFIGVVQDGEFWILSPAPPAGGMARLTTIGMQEAVAPESGEIDLTPYEGSALMVHGQDGGGWIYLAEVIDQGGPILTEVVKQVFRQGKRAAHLA
jgi:hypothetical protein